MRITSALAALALLGTMFVATPAVAANQEDKFQRGLTNLLTGFIELPATIKEESTATNPVQGITVGLIKGSFRAVKRTTVGLYEIVTFPFAGSSDYGPIIDPEHAWSRFD